MRFLLLVLFSCWGSIATLRAQIVAPVDTGSVRCVIRTSKTEYYFREPIAFDVRLINGSKQPVVLVDGDINCRLWDCFPQPVIRIYRLRGHLLKKLIEENYGSSCLRSWPSAENFALVGPSQYLTLEITREVGVPLLFRSFKFYEQLRPGEYEVRFSYSTVTDVSAIRRLIYDMPKNKQAEILTLINRVPAMNLNSAPIYLTITRAKRRG